MPNNQPTKKASCSSTGGFFFKEYQSSWAGLPDNNINDLSQRNFRIPTFFHCPDFKCYSAKRYEFTPKLRHTVTFLNSLRFQMLFPQKLINFTTNFFPCHNPKILKWNNNNLSFLVIEEIIPRVKTNRPFGLKNYVVFTRFINRCRLRLKPCLNSYSHIWFYSLGWALLA